MRWKIGECEFDSITRLVLPTAKKKLGRLEAKLLEVLIDEYGTELPNSEIISRVWGIDGSDASLYKAIEHIRDAFGGERESYVVTGPYQLTHKPLSINEGASATKTSIEVTGPGAQSRDHVNSLPKPSKDFTLIVDGMIINSVSELLYEDPETSGIRKMCAESYRRSLEDLAFAAVYATRIVTGKDFRPSLTTPDQPGQELAARLGEICEQRAFPDTITDGHLFRDERTRAGIRDDIRQFAQCVADPRSTHFFRDYVVREAIKHLGTDKRLFQDDIPSDQYKFDVKRPYYTDRRLQDELGNATDILVGFLSHYPGRPDDKYATNALREFVSRNVLSLITIMWEGEEFGRLTDSWRIPHVLRALVTKKRPSHRGVTQRQELVREMAFEHALSVALRTRQPNNRHNLLAVLLDLRDRPPFKAIRELLNREHLMFLKPGIEREEAAKRALKELRALTASTTLNTDNVQLVDSVAIRSFSPRRLTPYEFELYSVFPELDQAGR